jgi:hypothetical protein
MDIGEVLSKAWKIIWKHKVLWIFGILAGCGSANSSGGGGSGYQASGSNQGQFSFYAIDRLFRQVPDWAWLVIGLAIIALVILLVIAAIVLNAVGRAGLVRGTQLAEQGVERLAFGELFRYSLRYFWRIFGLSLLVGIATFLGVLFVGIPFSIITCGIGALILVIALLLLPIVVEMSITAIVIENLGVIDGLRRGWQVFRDNLGTMIIMGLILSIGLGFLVLLVIGGPTILLLAPLIGGVIYGTEQSLQTGLLISGLCFLGLLPLLLIVMGALRAFIGASWTLTFLRLTQPSAPEPVQEPLPEPS